MVVYVLIHNKHIYAMGLQMQAFKELRDNAAQERKKKYRLSHFPLLDIFRKWSLVQARLAVNVLSPSHHPKELDAVFSCGVVSWKRTNRAMTTLRIN